MKIANSIRTSTHLSLTPNLAAAIKILQLSQFELFDEIKELSLKNPFIEYELNIPNQHSWVYSSKNHEEYADFLNQVANPASLVSHLHWQLLSSRLDDSSFAHAEELIISLDESGFLPEDFWGSVPSKNREILYDWLKSLDPLGVGAKNINECLKWQLLYDQRCERCPLSKKLLKVLEEIDTDCSLKDLKAVIKKYFTATDQEMINDLLSYLSFRPADKFNDRFLIENYVLPDLITIKNDSTYDVYLNEETLPKINLCNDYEIMLKDKQLKNLYQEAKCFLKSISTRHETLLTVAKALVQRQQEFFHQGKGGLKPLILDDIAAETGYHGSTISRVTTNKYIQTPHGLYELKVLLSRGLKKKSGEIASTTSIKEVIIEMLRFENKLNPLSDMEISDILSKQGFLIARRTVAKYREQLGIAPSNERRTKK